MSTEPDDVSAEPERQTVIDYSRSTQARQDRFELEDYIEERIRECARALARGGQGEYLAVAESLRDRIIPSLADYCDRPLRQFDHDLDERRRWHWQAFDQFLKDADEIVATLRESTPPSLDQIGLRSRGFSSDTQTARRITQQALESVASIAEEVDIIMDAFESNVDAVGFAGKVGEHLQDQEMDIGDPVRVVTERSGALKTLFCGGTGQGKSAALETEAADYYTRNFEEGRDVKLLDLVGLRDGENWFYDIEQQQPDLARIRENMGLSDDLEDGRRLEILVPMTPGIATTDLPYDTERDDFVVKPFTVPASEIRKPLLVSMIAAKLTGQQEAAVRNAYDALDYRRDDWKLGELADEIRSSEEMDPEKRKSIIATLQQLQNHGFIRTKEHEHTVEWRDIFTDSKTITVFSQALMPDDDLIPRLICFGYLAWTIVKQRERMHGVPECVLLMRELWKVAPHNRRQAFDNRAASLQEAIGNMLSQLFRENRHSGVHVLADTQQPSDLLKPVREMFNRYVVFDTNRDTVKDIFEWTANDRWKSFYNTLTPKPGEASIVGMVEPAINERRIEFVGPIKYAPPPHHHRDARKDKTGWHARTKYRDGVEELRTANEMGVRWDDQVPTRLMIETVDEDEGVDPEQEPVKAFVEECIDVGPTHSEVKKDVRAAFNAWALQNDIGIWDFDSDGVKQRFGKRFQNSIAREIGNTTKGGDLAYQDVSLSSKGWKYLNEDMDGLQDSAEPILGNGDD